LGLGGAEINFWCRSNGLFSSIRDHASRVARNLFVNLFATHLWIQRKFSEGMITGRKLRLSTTRQPAAHVDAGAERRSIESPLKCHRFCTRLNEFRRAIARPRDRRVRRRCQTSNERTSGRPQVQRTIHVCSGTPRPKRSVEGFAGRHVRPLPRAMTCESQENPDPHGPGQFAHQRQRICTSGDGETAGAG